VVENVNKIKDTSPYSSDLLRTYIERIENILLTEIQGKKEITLTDNSELSVDGKYKEIYEQYAIAQIDVANQEFDLYNNDIALFEATYENYRRDYIRNHRPTRIELIEG
jgi:hypothetical protein